MLFCWYRVHRSFISLLADHVVDPLCDKAGELFIVSYLLGRPERSVPDGLTFYPWCIFFLSFLFHHSLSQLPRPIALKLCHVVGIWLNSIIPLQKFGEGRSPEMEYCIKYCNSIAILTWKKVLQSVLQYFFNQVLLLLLQYFLPVLLTTLELGIFSPGTVGDLVFLSPQDIFAAAAMRQDSGEFVFQ